MNVKKFKKLIGEEMSLGKLSVELQMLDCEDITDFGNLADLMDDGDMVVAVDPLGEEHIQVYYDINFLADTTEESILATILKVTKIEEF